LVLGRWQHFGKFGGALPYTFPISEKYAVRFSGTTGGRLPWYQSTLYFFIIPLSQSIEV
jgi:hypothetical protein